MGRAGRCRVIQSFSWPESVARVVELYQELTALSPSQSGKLATNRAGVAVKTIGRPKMIVVTAANATDWGRRRLARARTDSTRRASHEPD